MEDAMEEENDPHDMAHLPVKEIPIGIGRWALVVTEAIYGNHAEIRLSDGESDEILACFSTMDGGRDLGVPVSSAADLIANVVHTILAEPGPWSTSQNADAPGGVSGDLGP